MIWDFAQLLAYSLVTGSIYALFALSFVTYYRVSRRFDLLFAAYFTVGCYFSTAVSTDNLTVVLCCLPVLMGAVAAMAALVESIIYRPIETWSNSPLLCLIASLGLYFMATNILALLFGDSAISAFPQLATQHFSVGGTPLVLSGGQLASAIIASTLFVVLVIGLTFTNLGLIARAAGENPLLARLQGVRPRFIYLLVVCTAAAFSAAAGVCYSADLPIQPSLGMTILLVAVTIALGSTGRGASAIMLLSFALAALSQASSYFLGSRWAEATTYVLFVLVAIWMGLSQKYVVIRRQ